MGCKAGLVLTNLKGIVREYVLRIRFKASNNKAKTMGLKIAKYLGV